MSEVYLQFGLKSCSVADQLFHLAELGNFDYAVSEEQHDVLLLQLRELILLSGCECDVAVEQHWYFTTCISQICNRAFH